MTKDAYVDLDSFQTYAGPVIRVFLSMKVTYFLGRRLAVYQQKSNHSGLG